METLRLTTTIFMGFMIKEIIQRYRLSIGLENEQSRRQYQAINKLTFHYKEYIDSAPAKLSIFTAIFLHIQPINYLYYHQTLIPSSVNPEYDFLPF